MQISPADPASEYADEDMAFRKLGAWNVDDFDPLALFRVLRIVDGSFQDNSNSNNRPGGACI